MRRRTRHDEDQAEVNMTPMLDIVFILLIFFIVTATFLSEEGLDMRPPPDCGDECPPPPPDATVILVQVDEEDNVFVNQVRSDVDRVLSAVNRYRAEAPSSPVLITVSDEASHGVIVQIWDEMKANEVPVSLSRDDGNGG
ncbi:MAG: biopolymer transporter ExbD [Maricaulis sp.]|jgi:biopolymer transport protein ExbD|nr:biopolymer transporter ExbD [Maricaulis sp.]